MNQFVARIVFTVLSMGIAHLNAQDSLRVMYYNLLKFPGSTPERADTLKRILAHIEPDVLIVSELISESGADLILDKALNRTDEQEFKRAQFVDGYDTDNMFFYNSKKIELLNQSEIATDLRDINEYVAYVLPVLDDTIFIRFYAAHLKASPGSSEQLQRAAEAQQLKNHLDNLTSPVNIIFGGDMNIYSATEAAWEVITQAGNHPLKDPINQVGNWHDNPIFAAIHTQSTRNTQFGGGATGGMDDRFDFIFVNEEILNGLHRVSYLGGSYQAIGQDGIRLNQSLISPTNFTEPDSVLSALYYMSDHLPVILDLVIEQLNVSIRHSSVVNKIKVFAYDKEIFIEGIQNQMLLTLFDLTGKLVKSTKIQPGDNRFLKNEKLDPGIYFYILLDNTNDHYQSGKLYISP